jgi:hypothetical protein
MLEDSEHTDFSNNTSSSKKAKSHPPARPRKTLAHEKNTYSEPSRPFRKTTSSANPYKIRCDTRQPYCCKSFGSKKIAHGEFPLLHDSPSVLSRTAATNVTFPSALPDPFHLQSNGGYRWRSVDDRKQFLVEHTRNSFIRFEAGNCFTPGTLGGSYITLYSSCFEANKQGLSSLGIGTWDRHVGSYQST